MPTTTIAVGLVLVRLGMFIAVLLTASLWRIFKKAGRPGWPALVPFYNGYLTMEISGKPGWWILLYLVPVVNIFVAAETNIALARNFGKSTGFGVGLLLLPFIYYPMLADGEAAYVAAAPAEGGPRALQGRRGALLSACLIFFLPFAVLGTAILLTGHITHDATLAGGSTALLVALNLAIVIGLAGIWKWRKWGVYLFFAAELVLQVMQVRTALLAPAAYRLTVPGLAVAVIGAVILLVVFACAIGREWRHFQSATEPGVSRAIPAATAAAPRTGQVTVHLSEDPKTDFAKLAFKGEIFRFLTSERTKNYERQSGAWWSREDLKLVVVKKYSADFAADVLFREAQAAIDELAKQGEIVGTASGYRAK